jgi:3-isopropylmalate dehydrogenase
MTPKDVYDLALLPGDGIGAEVAAEARALLDVVSAAIGVRFAIDEIPCGGKYYLEHGRDWPEDAEARCDRADAILLGAVGWAGADGQPVTMHDGKMAGWSPVIGNRIRLDLYANIRPVKVFPGLRQGLAGRHDTFWRAEDVDLVVIRENTEGLYSGMGGVLQTGGRASVATDVRLITRAASEKVIRRAFEVSRERGRGAPADGKKRVTCVVKNNVLFGCKLFLEVYREVAAGYPDIEQDVAIVDAFAMFVLTQPQKYDVVVTTNMFGDILTDLASVLQGGMGMAVGCNVGDAHAMFEPIHGSAPPLAGKDRANPIAMLLATGEAFGWLGRRFGDERLIRAHRAVEAAVGALVERGEPLTVDLVGAERGAPRSLVARTVRDDVAARLG